MPIFELPRVFSTNVDDQWGPEVASAGQGRFLVIWQDRASTYNERHGRWIDSNGEMLSEEQVFVRLDDGGIRALPGGRREGKFSFRL